MSKNVIVLAGANGHLGQLIAPSLVERGAEVRALIRRGSTSDTRDLRSLNVKLVEVDYFNGPELAQACENGACVVSAGRECSTCTTCSRGG